MGSICIECPLAGSLGNTTVAERDFNVMLGV